MYPKRTFNLTQISQTAKFILPPTSQFILKKSCWPKIIAFEHRKGIEFVQSLNSESGPSYRHKYGFQTNLLGHDFEETN